MKHKITKFAKISIIVIVSIILLSGAGSALLFYFYPAESVLKIIRSQSEAALGRKVEIQSLKYSIKGIVLTGVTISDTDPAGNQLPDTEPLLKADEAIITFSPMSIIKKDFKIKTIYFNKLAVRWVFDNEGKNNIQRLAEEIKQKTGTSGESKSNISLSKIILTDCALRLVNPPAFIKPLEGEYTVNSTIRIKNNSKFRVYDSGIVLPQKRGTIYPELEIDATDKFILTGMVKLENCSLPWVYEFTKKPLQLPFETVNGIVDNFEISLPEIKGHAKVVSTLRNSKSVIHADGWCNVDLNGNTVLIKDVKNHLNNSSSTLDSLLISTKAGEVKRFSVSNANYSIHDLKQLAPEIPSGFSGGLKGNLSYDGNRYSGRLQISDCSYRDRTEIFSGLNTEIDLVNNTFKKESIPVTVFGSNFNISIATTDSKFKSLYVLIKGNRLDLNSVKLGGGKSSSDFFFPVSLSGKLQIGELIYDTLTFKNNQMDFNASEKTIKINRLDTSVFGGNIGGSGRIDLTGDNPSAHLNAKFNNIKIHDIKFNDEKLNNRLFGFADGTANLGFIFRENMTETIRGNTTFTVSKGKVVNTGVQDGLIIFLAELRYKLKDLEFSRIYGNIDISGKNLGINSFIFNSEDLRLSMNGGLNSDLNANNMSMKLEFNNHFIKDIPRPAIAVFNEYLSGRWYTIPFALNGNITESKNIKMLKKAQ